MKQQVLQSLRGWFLVHFVVDFVIGVPLFILPEMTLSWLGIDAVELVTARIVAAALLSIGGTSLIVYNENADVFRALLRLKIIWSAFAIIALALSFGALPVLTGGVFLGLFVGFFFLWLFYLNKLT